MLITENKQKLHIMKISKKFGVKFINGNLSVQKPKFARFKLFVQFYDGNCHYPSYDQFKKFKFGVESKVKSESAGLAKLFVLLHKKTNAGKDYRYANIFCNIGYELNYDTGNYDYLVCTLTPSTLTWKDPLYWKPGENSNMLDIPKMRSYALQKNNEQESERIRLERETMFKQIILPI